MHHIDPPVERLAEFPQSKIVLAKEERNGRIYLVARKTMCPCGVTVDDDMTLRGSEVFVKAQELF